MEVYAVYINFLYHVQEEKDISVWISNIHKTQKGLSYKQHRLRLFGEAGENGEL